MKRWHRGFLVIGLSILAGCGSGEEAGLPTTEAPAPLRDGDFDYISTADPQTPDEERLSLHVPPGFEVELFAAEPDIGKPINMAFDARGRLWVTQSNAYPFPESDGDGTDRLTILEDTDGDGRADTFTDFADDLNIPIGIVPVPDGAVVFSIPNVYRLTDTDGDDRADERTVLLGEFGHRDTHGMVNNFIRGFDGWIHAGHGYTNTSTVAGADGHEISMTSGNTFRFRMDGSRAELTTMGRVNPFGYAFDEWGYLYSADCHSTPIYQLIRGADYPHFGKQPSGIGFGPTMMDHNHGPTAIAGLALYTSNQFPPAFQQNFFSGNPVSNRVNRNSLTWRGSSPVAVQQPDFVVSDDPWFRPVDVKLGPDGALYIADFYNRIIGHYEVPLDHPGRDRERGRIWRIVYRGDVGPGTGPIRHTAPEARTDWTQAGLDTLLAGLTHPDLAVRMRVADAIVDRSGDEVRVSVEALLRDTASPATARVHGLWILYRLGALPDDVLAEAFGQADSTVRVHALRILFEYPDLNARQYALVKAALQERNPHVQRAAVEVLGAHPRREAVEPLLALREDAPGEDTHLVYALRQSLRDHLRADAIRTDVVASRWEEAEARALADVLVGVAEPGAGQFLLDHLRRVAEPQERRVAYLQHSARYLPQEHLDDLVAFAQTAAAGDEEAFDYFRTIQEGIARRGGTLPAAARAWGNDLAMRLVQSAFDERPWTNMPLEGVANQRNPWVVRDLETAAGTTVPMLTSLPLGDRLTGVLASPTFSVPETLQFYVAGHMGTPDEAPGPNNVVRLRLASTDEVLEEVAVPRADQAERVTWDLSEYAGQEAYLELVDRVSAINWGWIGAGGFEPPVVDVPAVGPADEAEHLAEAVNLAGTLAVHALEEDLRALLADAAAAPEVRASAAEALVKMAPEAHLALIAERLIDGTEPTGFREQLVGTLEPLQAPAALEALEGALPYATYRLQVRLAEALASTPEGAGRLVAAARDDLVSPGVLVEPSVAQRLEAVPGVQDEVAALTRDLEPVDEARQRLIDERLAGLNVREASVEEGAAVYAAQCAACHQVGGEGGLIGPQLDGIGRWGAALLTEHILAPNRSVPDAFQINILTLQDGTVVSGLPRREEGELEIFANAAGEEFSVPKSAIAERSVVATSLMPDQFGEIIPPDAFNALIAYLLTLE